MSLVIVDESSVLIPSASLVQTWYELKPLIIVNLVGKQQQDNEPQKPKPEQSVILHCQLIPLLHHQKSIHPQALSSSPELEFHYAGGARQRKSYGLIYYSTTDLPSPITSKQVRLHRLTLCTTQKSWSARAILQSSILRFNQNVRTTTTKSLPISSPRWSDCQLTPPKPTTADFAKLAYVARDLFERHVAKLKLPPPRRSLFALKPLLGIRGVTTEEAKKRNLRQ